MNLWRTRRRVRFNRFKSPFYSENYKTENEQRDLARFQDHAFWESNWGRRFLLSEDGIFSVIVHTKKKKILGPANEYECIQKLLVKGNANYRNQTQSIGF
jgi:tRNA1Val (adenine37-N6)-methyltransferase